MRAWVVLLSAAFGCGRYHFAPDEGDGNTRDRDGGVIDVMADAFVPCTSGYAAWQPPQPLTQLDTAADDWGGQITANGLALYFSRGPQLMVSRRPDRGSAFEPPVEVTELASVGDVSPTADELELFSDVDDGSGSCIHRSTRSDIASPWSPPVAIPGFCGADRDACPYVSLDALTIFYYDSAASTIARSTRADRSSDFGAPILFPGLFTGISCPAITGDMLELFDDGGSPETIMENPRASTTVGFMGGGAPISAINGAYDQTDTSITADGTELFFASDRPGAGGYDLYYTVRSCL